MSKRAQKGLHGRIYVQLTTVEPNNPRGVGPVASPPVLSSGYSRRLWLDGASRRGSCIYFDSSYWLSRLNAKRISHSLWSWPPPSSALLPWPPRRLPASLSAASRQLAPRPCAPAPGPPTRVATPPRLPMTTASPCLWEHSNARRPARALPAPHRPQQPPPPGWRPHQMASRRVRPPPASGSPAPPHAPTSSYLPRCRPARPSTLIVGLRRSSLQAFP